MKTLPTLCVIAAMLSLVWPHHAARSEEISNLDVKIEIRVLDFLRDPAHRNKVAVVYDQGNANSRREAEFTLRALREFSALARASLAPVMLDRRGLAVNGDYAALLLGPAMAEFEDDALAYGIAHHTLVLSAGRDCVRRGKCAVGVSSLPEVEIALNPDVVRKSGIRFADGFQLMVKEY